MFVRSIEEVRIVQLLVARGLNDCAIARSTGLPLSTVRNWRSGRCRRVVASMTTCRACGHAAHDASALPPAAYAYLLGLYLGDGHISAHRRGVSRLSVYLDVAYPGIVEECRVAMECVLPGQPALVQRRQSNCFAVSMFSKQWPCLFPQHGLGRKHERPIVLADWQQSIVEEHGEALLRGLVHSDGWRGTNRVVVRGKAYEYGRYEFSNRSEDVKRIFCDACDRLGNEWRVMNRHSISVARRGSVARLDEFVGHKR